MKEIFADTSYFVALLHPDDNLHQIAIDVSIECGNATIVTSDGVVTEVFNWFAEKGQSMRQLCLSWHSQLINDPNIIVVPQMRDRLNSAVNRYGQRLDKGYSLTDCYSMLEMNFRSIREVLTHDHHFEQEGFIALLRNR